MPLLRPDLVIPPPPAQVPERGDGVTAVSSVGDRPSRHETGTGRRKRRRALLDLLMVEVEDMPGLSADDKARIRASLAASGATGPLPASTTPSQPTASQRLAGPALSAVSGTPSTGSHGHGSGSPGGSAHATPAHGPGTVPSAAGHGGLSPAVVVTTAAPVELPATGHSHAILVATELPTPSAATLPPVDLAGRPVLRSPSAEEQARIEAAAKLGAELRRLLDLNTDTAQKVASYIHALQTLEGAPHILETDL
ncbi:MAG: hypothetical protein RLY86_1833 [Pseudomonadota bacterium]|jgi:hypothetical protein